MSWFSKWFGREKDLDPADLSVLKVDMHSHLIPAIDDGSKSMEDSISMLRKFKELGYSEVITTPHVMSDFYRNTPEIIRSGLEKVQSEVKKLQLGIQIDAAAEYYSDEFLEEKISQKAALTIGKEYLLFELPFIAEPQNLNEIIFSIQTNGYKPILAHPERYPYWYNNFEKFKELKERGVFLQLNILSLIGHYSPETKKIAERLIDAQLISFLGSDCHNMHHLELIEKARKKKYLHQLLESGNILNHTLSKY